MIWKTVKRLEFDAEENQINKRVVVDGSWFEHLESQLLINALCMAYEHVRKSLCRSLSGKVSLLHSMMSQLEQFVSYQSSLGVHY
jgi:hypothetical protein